MNKLKWTKQRTSQLINRIINLEFETKKTTEYKEKCVECGYINTFYTDDENDFCLNCGS